MRCTEGARGVAGAVQHAVNHPAHSLINPTTLNLDLRSCAQVPAASLALFNTLSIILLIPVYDRGLVPLLRRFGTKLTLLSRIGEAQGLGLRA